MFFNNQSLSKLTNIEMLNSDVKHICYIDITFLLLNERMQEPFLYILLCTQQKIKQIELTLEICLTKHTHWSRVRVVSLNEVV